MYSNMMDCIVQIMDIPNNFLDGNRLYGYGNPRHDICHAKYKEKDKDSILILKSVILNHVTNL